MCAGRSPGRRRPCLHGPGHQWIANWIKRHLPSTQLHSSGGLPGSTGPHYLRLRSQCHRHTSLRTLFQRVLHPAKALAMLAGACMGVHGSQEQPDACSIKVAGFLTSCGGKQQTTAVSTDAPPPPSLMWRSPWSSDAPQALCHPAPRRAAAMPISTRGAQQVAYLYRKLHPGDGAEARTR